MNSVMLMSCTYGGELSFADNAVQLDSFSYEFVILYDFGVLVAIAVA